jgi:multisubunit Na+/H+ antiporter MnhB subunit
MTELATLLLPILLSGIAVFFASFLAWVVIGHHAPDWSEIPDEGNVIDFIRAQGLKPGQYIFPIARTKEAMADETKKQRILSGPWGTLNLWSRQVHMGRNLLQTFVFYLVTSFFIAYLATLALEPGAAFLKVFQVTGTAGILAYAFGHVPNSIWFGTHRRPMLMDILDGVCFGLLTGLIFAAFWP